MKASTWCWVLSIIGSVEGVLLAITDHPEAGAVAAGIVTICLCIGGFLASECQ